jgi:hypothetical protein
MKELAKTFHWVQCLGGFVKTIRAKGRNSNPRSGLSEELSAHGCVAFLSSGPNCYKTENCGVSRLSDHPGRPPQGPPARSRPPSERCRRADYMHGRYNRQLGTEPLRAGTAIYSPDHQNSSGTTPWSPVKTSPSAKGYASIGAGWDYP